MSRVDYPSTHIVVLVIATRLPPDVDTVTLIGSTDVFAISVLCVFVLPV